MQQQQSRIYIAATVENKMVKRRELLGWLKGWKYVSGIMIACTGLPEQRGGDGNEDGWVAKYVPPGDIFRTRCIRVAVFSFFYLCRSRGKCIEVT